MLAESALLRGTRSVYRVIRRLAEGGMGVVWIGVDLGNDEEVVIKEPKPIPVAMAKSRFEAELLRRLHHPHVVKYIDEARTANTSIIVEELVRGETLYEMIKKRGPLDPGEAAARLAAMLLALDAIHSKNIIHRDLKPKNIMTGPSPHETKIIDMGTAIYYNVSGLGELVYSPGGYTAPEQYMGYAFPQSDIWGVMATAFYMVTGRDPAEQMQGYYPRYPPPRPPDPRLYNPRVPDRLARIIMKGMAWHVLDRFSTAREALDALTGAAAAQREPVIEVMGIVIPIRTESLIFGRKQGTSVGTTVEPAGQAKVIGLEEEQRVTWRIENGYTLVEVSDPYRWISRRHFEIRRLGRGWCIRDLGSTNRTAVMTKKGVFEVWQGRGRISACFPLEPRSLVLVAYGNSLRNTPYMTVFFRMPGA